MRFARRPRLATALHLAASLGTVGLAGYVYVALAGRIFAGPAGAGAVSALISLYLLINIIGPGVFTALEQETSRSVSAAAALGASIRPAVARSGGLAAITGLGLTALAVAAWPLGLHRVLDGRKGLLIALLLAIVGSGAAYWSRGVLAGQGRFRAYAATFYVEGLVRLLPLSAFGAAAIASPGPEAYGLVFASGSLLAAAFVWPVTRKMSGRTTDAAPAGMGRSFALLVGATALSQTIANLAPVVATFRLSDDTVSATVFSSGFVLARVPLFLLAPVLAVLLPGLARDVAQGRLDLASRRVRRMIVVLMVLGGVGVAVGATAGPRIVQLLFNTAERPDAHVLVVLGGSTTLLMLALVLQPALIALGRNSDVTAGWVSGAVVFGALLAAPFEPVAGALIAQTAAPAVVCVVLTLRLRLALSAAVAVSVAPTGGVAAKRW